MNSLTVLMLDTPAPEAANSRSLIQLWYGAPLVTTQSNPLTSVLQIATWRQPVSTTLDSIQASLGQERAEDVCTDHKLETMI